MNEFTFEAYMAALKRCKKESDVDLLMYMAADCPAISAADYLCLCMQAKDVLTTLLPLNK